MGRKYLNTEISKACKKIKSSEKSQSSIDEQSDEDQSYRKEKDFFDS